MNQRRYILIVIDIGIMISVYILTGFILNFNMNSIAVNGKFTIGKLLVLIAITIGTRGFFKIYKSVWRYSSVRAYLRMVISDMIACALFVILGTLVGVVSLGIAASTIIFMSILILSLCSRFVYQYLYAQKGINDDGTGGNKINIAIIGAGNVGVSLAKSLIRNPKAHYSPVCFIDTDHSKKGNAIDGIPIYMEDEKIVEQIKKMPIQECVIAIPDVDREERTRLYELYKQTGCKVKLYGYPLNDNEEMGKRSLRDFQIEDLLFRDPLKVKSEKTINFYENKIILVTGGGGSIGSELCRQIAKLQPKKLVIVDIYENNAYDIQQELIRKYGSDLELDVYIASVRDVKRMDEIFRLVRPELVFHAAAHKHVPLMQFSGCEAIKNNVMGTYNVANLAEKYGVRKFLLISTDKAVNPANIMGASKRLCEMVIQCRHDSETEFTAVRFGNVLGSNGSVIPLFKKQIAAGGPITLTDRRIIRYFMTIPEAVGLVMETCCMARNGELFVLDMGKPVKILDLAENMIKLSGLIPYEDIDIVEIGLRPGEKLYEELLMKTEELDKTENSMIFIERDKRLSRNAVDHKLSVLMDAVEKETGIIEAIKQTVPTYHDPNEVNCIADKAEEMKMVV